jgi:hypothetical protein
MTAPREKTTKKQSKPHVGHALLEFARECTKDIPIEEFEKLPKDGAHQHDHYLYGTPKRND